MKINVYHASAGSGKTFQLVFHYLKYLFASDNSGEFRHILAITFTNNATYEMKKRILSALSGIAGLIQDEKTYMAKIQPLVTLLCQELHLSPTQLKEKAKRVLSLILHNYSEFHVMTIDKFSNKIIRSFATDFHLSPQYNIETDTDSFIEETIDRFLVSFTPNDEIFDVIYQFLVHNLLSEDSWNIRKYLIDLLKYLLANNINEKLQDLSSRNLTDLIQMKDNLHTLESALAEAIHKKIVQWHKNIDAFDYSRYLNAKTKLSEILLTLRKFPQNDTIKILHARILSPLQENKIKEIYFKKAAWNDPHVLEFINQLNTEYPATYKLFSSYLICRQAHQHFFLFIIMKEINQLLQQLKKEKETIFIDDLHFLIQQVVQQEPAPFIYEKLGHKFSFFLIDEFQDTSILQWNNLQPLIAESQSFREKPTQVFIVGDTKQSIYRFRGGKPEQMKELFHSARNGSSLTYLSPALIRQAHINPHVLNENRRSGKAIVHFNNTFFHYLQEHSAIPDLPQYYSHHEQKAVTGHEGYVKIEFISDNISSDTPSDMSEDPFMPPLMEILNECLQEGFQYSDIVILTHKKSTGKAIADYLLQQKPDIPLASNEILELNNSSDLQLLMRTLEWLHQPDDPTSRYLFAEKLHATFPEKFDPFFPFLFMNSPSEKDAFTLTEKGFNLSPLSSFSHYYLFDLIIHIIQQFGFPLQNIYITTFLNHIHQLISQYGYNLLAIIKWWHQKGKQLSVQISDNTHALNIMTVHKSKGLEFPVVIFSHLGAEGVRETTEYYWFNTKDLTSVVAQNGIPLGDITLPSSLLIDQKSLKMTCWNQIAEKNENEKKIDTINQIYVGFTRAIHRLYILAAHPKNSRLFSRSKQKEVISILHNYCNTHGNTFGTKEKKSSSPTSSVPRIPDNITIRSGEWKKRIKIASLASDPFPWLSSVHEHEKVGTLIHHCLEKNHSAEACLEHWNRLCKQHSVAQHSYEKYSSILKAYFDMPIIKEIYASAEKIMSEFEIQHAGSSTIIRPDKLIKTADKWYLLDFKTGTEEEGHLKQIMRYKQVLVDELHFSPLTALLIYLNNPVRIKES